MNQAQTVPERPSPGTLSSNPLESDQSSVQSLEISKNRTLSSSSSLSSLAGSVNDFGEDNLPPSPLTPMSGVLLKWTNYIHGWQQRFIVLEDGTLSYYKSEDEKSFGCRGAIMIIKANIKLHETDECRFDVGVSDCVWYLWAPTVDECRRWVSAIQEHKAYYQANKVDPGNHLPLIINESVLQNGATSQYVGPTGNVPMPLPAAMTSVVYGDSLCRHESALSLSSITSCRSYKEQLSEMETFRTILYQQIKTLQHYFDSSLQSTNLVNEHLKRHRRHQSMNGFNYNLESNEANRNASNAATDGNQSKSFQSSSTENDQSNGSNVKNQDIFVDFKKEAFTFKATTAGIITSLSNCIELMNQREEQWKKRLDKEQQRKRKSEEHSKRLGAELEETRRALAELQLELQRNMLRSNKDQVMLIGGGSDYQEGPHNIINEDEFFDAIDAALDRAEQPDKDSKQHESQTMNLDKPLDVIPPERCDHILWPDIEHSTMEQLYYARLEVKDTPVSGGSNWELFAQDGDLSLYKREMEVDGLACDPLKAVHIVKGVTGHEVCHQFFSPDVRFNWETSLVKMDVVENINPNTLVFHQIHKRVWPASQRDAVFWSHIRKIDSKTLEANGNSNSSSEELPDNVWIVCNKSVDRPEIDTGRCLRVKLIVSMCCETYIDSPVKDVSKLTRDQLRCRIIYCSTIHPGGWAPTSLLRTIYKREYPRFMKRFSEYCIDFYKDKPIMI